jgi:hypothetical protein
MRIQPIYFGSSSHNTTIGLRVLVHELDDMAMPKSGTYPGRPDQFKESSSEDL